VSIEIGLTQEGHKRIDLFEQEPIEFFLQTPQTQAERMPSPLSRQTLERSEVGKVGRVGVEDVSAESIADELAVACGVNEARGLEFFHVVGEGGGTDRLRIFDFGTLHGGATTGADLAEEIEATRVCKSLGDQVDLRFGEFDGQRVRWSFRAGMFGGAHEF
jgi:hypothetical protein